MKVSALIPVKGFRNAKQRLSSLLNTAEREQLAEIMFRHVVSQVLRVRGLVETVVVTRDDGVSEIASSLGARVIREPAEKGETEAVDFARRQLKATGTEAVLILPSDMPLICSADIENLLAQLPKESTAPFVLLVPSHDRLGTNALVLAPPDLINLRFGYDSFTYHMNQVSARGLPMRFLENERIALDIDEPKDFERYLSFEDEKAESASAVRALLATHNQEKNRRSGGV